MSLISMLLSSIRNTSEVSLTSQRKVQLRIAKIEAALADIYSELDEHYTDYHKEKRGESMAGQKKEFIPREQLSEAAAKDYFMNMNEEEQMNWCLRNAEHEKQKKVL